MQISIKEVFTGFESFYEKSLSSPIVTYRDILPLLSFHKKNKGIKIKQIGKSIDGKVLYSVQIGTGKIKVLAWSQMHGDESTATRTFFDLLNFIERKENQKIVKNLFSHITLYLIPMLNPDGAEKQKRFNALGIDINRDAVDLVSPEAEILERLFREISPDFALNLHDQDGWYSVGESGKPTAISFLATTPDAKKSKTEERKRAMSVIGKTASELCKYAPGHIAKYSDEYEPRAFGDNFAQRGASVILIEAGRWENDENKDFIRKLYFTSLMTVIKTIAAEKYTAAAIKVYNEIPENKELIYDLILRKVKLNNKYIVDIGIKRYPIYDKKKGRIYEGKIEAIGDLSIYSAFEEYLFEDCTAYPAEKLNFGSIKSSENFKKSFWELAKSGIAIIEYKKSEEKEISRVRDEIPLNYVKADCEFSSEIFPGNYANFVLKNKKGEKEGLILNGFFINLLSEKSTHINSIRI